MQLKTVDGKLTLGSVYKLFVWGSLICLSIVAVAGLVLMAFISVARGEFLHDGPILVGILVLAPVMVLCDALLLGAVITFGVWVYRLRRPLTVIPEDRGMTV